MLFNLPSTLRCALYTATLLSSLVTPTQALTPAEYLKLKQDGNSDLAWVLTSDGVEGKPALRQNDTNGNSLLGSLDAPTYGSFIPSGKRDTSPPWGSRTALKTNPYEESPDTGIIRKYTFNLARGMLASDGIPKSVMLVNGQFPGPTIEANWGDMIQVTVINNLENEGTAVHWHGMLQTGTNDQDGVPGITQCPIAPGQNYTYSFRASLYGTSWYHAHYSAQYVSGLYGAMIIHGPTDNAPYDIDLGPVLLADYYYRDYYSVVKDVMGNDSSKIIPKSDNNLINGKGVTDCTRVNSSSCTPNAGLARFRFQPGKVHRLRLINAGAEGIQKFSIDHHPMRVMAVDFVPVTPYTTNIVTLGVGQRVDVLVYAGGQATDYIWMRSTISSCSARHQPNALAIINYSQADPHGIPSTTAFLDPTDPCAEEPLSQLTPSYPIPFKPSLSPDTTLELDIAFLINATGSVLWTINNSSFKANYNVPLLPLLTRSTPAPQFPPTQNTYDLGSARTTRLIINNNSPAAHPMHLHGFDFQILAAAPNGRWNGSFPSVSSNSNSNNKNLPSNPARRDTYLLPPNGYVVLQFQSTNPGIWPFHCHIAWHVSGGLYANFVAQTAMIPAQQQQRKNETQGEGLCLSWDKWTQSLSEPGSPTTVVDQIDSGL